MEEQHAGEGVGAVQCAGRQPAVLHLQHLCPGRQPIHSTGIHAATALNFCCSFIESYKLLKRAKLSSATDAWNVSQHVDGQHHPVFLLC